MGEIQGRAKDMNPKYPGMNPYLEQPKYWQSFHNEFIFCLHEELGRVLPAGYRSSVEQRLAILPDVNYIRADIGISARPVVREALEGGTAVAERGAPTGMVGALSDEMLEWFIEISMSGGDRKVVAIIEVLSPSNKVAGSVSWKDYLQRQIEILRSDTHLMEIDLLRFGAHSVAAPLVKLPLRDQWDYIVSLYRAPDRTQFAYWLNKLSEPLLEVRVPLLPGDPDVILDLQAAFDHAFRSGRYADEFDYSQSPPSA